MVAFRIRIGYYWDWSGIGRILDWVAVWYDLNQSIFIRQILFLAMSLLFQTALVTAILELPFSLRLVIAVLLLWFSATIFSLYQQEKRIPSLKRIKEEMAFVWQNFPSILFYRVTTAPKRLEKSFSRKKYKLFHSIAKRLVNNLPNPKKGTVKGKIITWVEKHSIPIEGSLLFKTKSKKHEAKSIAEALLEHPAQQFFLLKPDKIIKRYSIGKWSAYSLIQGPAKVWAISQKELKKTVKVRLVKTKNGFLAVVSEKL
jgi:hypothetical protein